MTLRLGWLNYWGSHRQLAQLLVRTDWLPTDLAVASLGFGRVEYLTESAGHGDLDVIFLPAPTAVGLLRAGPQAWRIMGQLAPTRVGMYVRRRGAASQLPAILSAPIGRENPSPADDFLKRLPSPVPPSGRFVECDVQCQATAFLGKNAVRTATEAFIGWDPILMLLEQRNQVTVVATQSVRNVILARSDVVAHRPRDLARLLAALSEIHRPYRDLRADLDDEVLADLARLVRNDVPSVRELRDGHLPDPVTELGLELTAADRAELERLFALGENDRSGANGERASLATLYQPLPPVAIALPRTVELCPVNRR